MSEEIIDIQLKEMSKNKIAYKQIEKIVGDWFSLRFPQSAFLSKKSKCDGVKTKYPSLSKWLKSKIFDNFISGVWPY